MNRLADLTATVYGEAFITILNFYINKDKESGKRKDVFTLLIEEPREAYESLLSFFKHEAGVRAFLEGIFAEAYRGTRREMMVNHLISSLKENNHERTLNYLLRLSQLNKK